MGVKVELRDGKGKMVKLNLGGDEFMQKSRFKEIIKAVKEMEGAEYDPALKMWFAALSKENLFCIDDYIDAEDRKKVNGLF